MANFIDLTPKAKPDLSNVDNQVVLDKIKDLDGIIGGSRDWTNQTLKMDNLPTSDPAIAGQLWNDNGTLKISAG